MQESGRTNQDAMRHQPLQVFLNLSKLIPYTNVELMQQVGGLCEPSKGDVQNASSCNRAGNSDAI